MHRQVSFRFSMVCMGRNFACSVVLTPSTVRPPANLQIVGLILWSRKKHRRQQRYADGVSAGAGVEYGGSGGHAEWAAGAASTVPPETLAATRRAHDEEEAVRRAIQVCIDHQQLVRIPRECNTPPPSPLQDKLFGGDKMNHQQFEVNARFCPSIFV